jgi:hypothetical protein
MKQAAATTTTRPCSADSAAEGTKAASAELLLPNHASEMVYQTEALLSMAA